MKVAENHHTARQRPSRLVPALRRAWPVAVLLLITVLMFWKLLLTDQYTWLEGPDLAMQVLPWWQFQAGEWHRGAFPLWDPNHWGGQPLIGQTQPGAAYPPNWLLFSLPLKDGWLRQTYLHWYFALARFLAAWFCYLLCRDLGRSKAASILAGCVFAFGGFVGTNDWPQMFNGAIWAPLVFLFLLRSIRGERRWASAAWSGLFLGVAWLSGHHQIPLFVSLGALSFWVYFSICERRIDGSVVRSAALFLLFAGAVGALQMLPAWEYGRHAHRWVGANEPKGWDAKVPYSVHEHYATPPSSLLGVVYPGRNAHTVPFIGMAAAALVAIALSSSFGMGAVRWFSVLGLGAFLCALGGMTLFHGVLYSLVPLVEKARSPSVCLMMFNFSCAVLCAFGIDSLTDSRAVKRIILALTAAGVATLLLVAGLEISGKGFTDQRTVTAGLYALLFAALLQGWRQGLLGPRTVLSLATVLVLLELSSVCAITFPNREDRERNPYLKQIADRHDLVEFLRSREKPLRVEVDDKVIPFNLGDMYGIEQAGGYLASLTSNHIPLEMHTERTIQLFGAGYFVGKEPRRPNQVPLYAGRDGFSVYENPGALARARVVRRFVRLHLTPQVPQFISDPANDLSTTASLLTDLPSAGTCTGPDEVQLVRHTSNRVTVHANLACRGMVVLADTWFPGWSATVDGRPERIYEPYGVLRGVMVDGGDHVIEMVYRPWTVTAGAALTGSGLLAGLLLLWGGRQR